MKSKKIIVLLLAVFILSIPGMAMAQGNVVYEKKDFGSPGGWTMIWRQNDNHLGLLSPGEAPDKILEWNNISPDLAGTNAVHSIQHSPAFIELLSINGVPWQLFESPGVYFPDDTLHYITIAEQIKLSLAEIGEKYTREKRNPYWTFRQVLPTGDKKMVSIYRDNFVGAYYTSTTVEPKELPGEPYADATSGRIMIPLRGVVDYLGAEIGWDSASKTVTIKAGDKEIKLKAGDKRIIVNGSAIETDSAPTIKEGVTFIPLRFVSEQLGYTVKWFGDKPADVPGNWENVPRADIYN